MRERGAGDAPGLREGEGGDERRLWAGFEVPRMRLGAGKGMRDRGPGMRSPKYTVLSHLGHLDAMAGERSRAVPCRAVL